MDKNQIIDLIGKLTGAALSLPQNKKEPSEENKHGSFVKATEPPPPPPPAPPPSAKPQKQPSDAIIKMINRHNALSREIAMKNKN